VLKTQKRSSLYKHQDFNEHLSRTAVSHNSQLTTCSTTTRPCSTDPADHSFLPQLSLCSSSPPSPPNTPPSPSMQINVSFHPNLAPRPSLVVLVPSRLAWSEDPSGLRLISSFAGKHARWGFASHGFCISFWALNSKSFILSGPELCASWLSINRVAFRLFLLFYFPHIYNTVNLFGNVNPFFCNAHGSVSYKNVLVVVNKSGNFVLLWSPYNFLQYQWQRRFMLICSESVLGDAEVPTLACMCSCRWSRSTTWK